MIKRQAGSTVWYEFEILQPFSYLRHGCFQSLNAASAAEGNNQPSIHETRGLIRSAFFGDHQGWLIEMNQVHGANIAVISSPSSPSGAYDGMATALCNTALLVKHADCQACLFFDPEHRVISAVHCGWRGNVQNIYEAAIACLQKQYGTRPEQLLACISPSLGPCHAEFKNWKQEFPSSFEIFRQENDHFNLWQISRQQLLACGLRPFHIEISGICTYCLPDQFFSYRRNKTTMRNATCIALASE